jgi:3-hydroxybutyryl-CoA dehydrogenase
MEVTLLSSDNQSFAGKPPHGVRRTGKPPASTAIALELTNTSRPDKKENLRSLDALLPPSALILSSSVAVTLKTQSAWVRHPERLAGIAALPTFLEGRLVEVILPPRASADSLERLKKFFGALGKETAVVKDSPGMVMPRILTMIINEAWFALADETASATDIDTAMKLGTNYPHGPLAWGERIGLAHVHAVIEGLHRGFREERYCVAPLLRRAASAAHPE